MTRDKQLAAFIAGTIQAALDNARSRGYPPELGLTEPRDGTWTVWAAGEDSRCTVTIAPGAGLPHPGTRPRHHGPRQPQSRS